MIHFLDMVYHLQFAELFENKVIRHFRFIPKCHISRGSNYKINLVKLNNDSYHLNQLFTQNNVRYLLVCTSKIPNISFNLFTSTIF